MGLNQSTKESQRLLFAHGRPRRLAEGSKVQLRRQQQPDVGRGAAPPVRAALVQGPPLRGPAVAGGSPPELRQLQTKQPVPQAALRAVQQRPRPQGPPRLLRQAPPRFQTPTVRRLQASELPPAGFPADV